MRWKQEFVWLKQRFLKLFMIIPAYIYKNLQMLSVTGMKTLWQIKYSMGSKKRSPEGAWRDIGGERAYFPSWVGGYFRFLKDGMQLL